MEVKRVRVRGKAWEGGHCDRRFVGQRGALPAAPSPGFASLSADLSTARGAANTGSVKQVLPFAEVVPIIYDCMKDPDYL